MKISLTPHTKPFVLASAATLVIKRPGWMRVSHGRLWLTRSGGPGDEIIAPGAWVWVAQGRGVVIEPLDAIPATFPRLAAQDAPAVTVQWHALPTATWRPWLSFATWRQWWVGPEELDGLRCPVC